MTDLNEFECEMLDTMLEAFSIHNSLTRKQLLELFDQDEDSALAMVQVLAQEDLIAKSGVQNDNALPEKLTLKPKGDKFFKEGGFIMRFQMEKIKPVETGGTLAKLQQHNMKLQTERLANEAQIFNLQKSINTLQIRQYIWWALILILFVIGYLIGHLHKK